MENIYDVIYARYKEYLETNSKYGVEVVEDYIKSTTHFPTITFNQTNNIDVVHSLYNVDYYEAYYFTIDIYTKDKKINGEMISTYEINKELETLTSEFFRKINFKKTLNRNTPNLDTSILRRTMQFQAQIGNRGNIIRR